MYCSFNFMCLLLRFYDAVFAHAVIISSKAVLTVYTIAKCMLFAIDRICTHSLLHTLQDLQVDFVILLSPVSTLLSPHLSGPVPAQMSRSALDTLLSLLKSPCSYIAHWKWCRTLMRFLFGVQPMLQHAPIVVSWQKHIRGSSPDQPSFLQNPEMHPGYVCTGGRAINNYIVT